MRGVSERRARSSSMTSSHSPSFEEISQIVYNGLVRLEITGGLPTWEAMPGALHNGVVDDIRQALTRMNIDNHTCGCYHIADTYIQFGASLLRRPDIAIFCERPPRPDGALNGVIPGAVIEILSAGYEQKDRDAIPLYLAAGIVDVILVDPRTNSAERHTINEATVTNGLPITWRLSMGCTLDIPKIDRA